MRELINDPFYEVIKSYNRCIIDYCLMEADTLYDGYRSHKEAILFAMCKLNERSLAYQLKAETDFNRNSLEKVEVEPLLWSVDIDKAKAECLNPDLFLYTPDIIKKAHSGKTHYACKLQDSPCGGQIPYWYAFLETPHPTRYGKDDFVKINHILFPNGAKSLEVYEWTTDWSNYFDDGHEWWGAACWSIYDRLLNRYVVIMASTTD